MKFTSALATICAATIATAKNILLTNDDGWASTGIRATYRELTAAGHNVYLVAPVEQRSGYGGTFMFTYTSTLLHDDQFHYKKEGDPAWGHEESDDHIWYFNGTPSASVAFAFDYLLPTYFANASIDLVVAGPNQGLNQDSLFTLSGTIGATYNAVYRGYPAIAFSGSNSNNSFFKDSLNDNPDDVQNIYASKVVELVDTLFAAQGDNPVLLPRGTGLNVNFPKVASDSTTGCTDPKYTFARLSGPEVVISSLKFNSSTGLFTFSYGSAIGSNVIYHGDAALPDENQVINHLDCTSDVALFSVDYTANIEQENEVRGMIGSILS
ncbi:CYFA0S10e04170g1_1 [Cyberlindnera fabianii]|uniref:CYFA0S10e04170g1_1 n=1 Tax=Cyberlindnera fabianii TaxID=36022 RepID=A0A061B0D8_CYBFA|nr:CYFA0S10e04170g1_1 [Cyberlindnera fabianii]